MGSFSVLSPSAFADDEGENKWERRGITMSYTGAYSDRRKMKIDSGEILYTTSDTKPGFYFSCLEGKFRAGLTFIPQDIRKAFSNLEGYGMNSRGNFVPYYNGQTYVGLYLDGGKRMSLGQWLYYEDKDITLSRKRKPAAQLYNAIVRKQSVRVEAKGDQVDLTAPKLNAAFADFGADCGLGRLKRKDDMPSN